MKPDTNSVRRLKSRFRRARLLPFVWSLLLTLSPVPAAHAAEAIPPVPERVLLYSYYGRENQGGAIFDQSVLSALRTASPGSIEFCCETLAQIVRLKAPTFREQYKWYVGGVISLCAVEVLLIASLLTQRRRRQRAKAALDRLNVELEGRVADRTSALAAKTRELESFTYTVAHDLRAPLRGIEGYSRLLLKNYSGQLDEEGQTLLRTICSSSDRMRRLIKDLLAYSLLEHMASAPGRLELRPFFEALVEEKRDEMEARGIKLSLHVNGGSVTTNAEGLAQALRNYLDNAIKFTRDAPHPRIELGADERDDGCRLWVRDNGVGFDMRHRERVFEIFQRLHGANDYPGTGVGLAIARKAAERIGGRTWAESVPGLGSTFYLELHDEGRAPEPTLPDATNTSPH